MAILLVFITLLDGFETILLPRRITRRFRYSRLYYGLSWRAWRRLTLLLSVGKYREAMLGVFGPLSMLGLFGSWVICLVAGFGLLHWSLQTNVMSESKLAQPTRLTTYVYFSGTSFFTLGLGDVAPVGPLPRALTVIEAGSGLGFLAIIIGYLPVLYQAFSRREATISLLDARAGSPPGGGEFISRLAHAGQLQRVDPTLREWEQWCAELLESHISFPVLAYYRSQHANQSWLAALATILDSSALLLALLPEVDPYQSQLTFAMARHAAVDIALIFAVKPGAAAPVRFGPETRSAFIAELTKAGLQTNSAGLGRFDELQRLYEPFITALASNFMLIVPPVFPLDRQADNWQRSSWMPRSPGIGRLHNANAPLDHFS